MFFMTLKKEKMVTRKPFFLFFSISGFPETKFLGLAELAETSNVRPSVRLSVRPSVRAVAPKLIVRSRQMIAQTKALHL